jgi:hypothetical protein
MGILAKMPIDVSSGYFLFARRLHESEEKSKYRK